VPDRIRESIHRYIHCGIKPGSFLRAVLNNDLITAVVLADETNAPLLAVIVAHVHDTVPADAWGSARAVESYSVRMEEAIARNNAESIKYQRGMQAQSHRLQYRNPDPCSGSYFAQ